jgi:hypothetical protein
MENKTIDRAEILKQYLKEQGEDVADLVIEESNHDETVYDADGSEYMILTDDEADEKGNYPLTSFNTPAILKA